MWFYNRLAAGPVKIDIPGQRRTPRVVQAMGQIGAGGRLNAAFERAQLAAWACEACGFVPVHSSQIDLDHIIPRRLGGTDEKSNIQRLCANCHRLKTAMDLGFVPLNPPPRLGSADRPIEARTS